jgi:pimeloyl-ACP methyl ester carboxylesterase
MARDLVVFVRSLGYERVACVVGHDFGAVSGSGFALMRPDMVERLVLMSHPFKSPKGVDLGASLSAVKAADAQQLAVHALNVAVAEEVKGFGGAPTQAAALAELDPPKKHYRTYNSTRDAIRDWDNPPDGLRDFFLAYLHVKSGLFEANKHASPLKDRSAAELARMPAYYIMPSEATMPSAVEGLIREAGDDAGRSLAWIKESELEVYVAEWKRTGFLGGLAWYRGRNDPYDVAADWALFAGREKLRMPVKFISGAQDWGNWQEYGALQAMESGKTCDQFKGAILIDGAGHWVQQEKPDQVVDEIVKFVATGSE